MSTYIFDLDGTLTDSNGLWLEVDHRFLSRRGLESTPEYLDGVARSIFPVAADFTKEYYGLDDDPADIMAEWESLAAHQYRYEVELKPGVAAFLEQCRRQGIRMAVFTACRPPLCMAVLERHGLARYFDRILFAEELGIDKHDPRCYRELCALLDTAPEHCLFFDDSPANCAAALAAGLKTVGVRDSFYANRQEELKASCSRYLSSLEELLEGNG